MRRIFSLILLVWAISMISTAVPTFGAALGNAGKGVLATLSGPLPHSDTPSCARTGLHPAPQASPVHGDVAMPDAAKTPGCVNEALTAAVLCAPGFRTGPYRDNPALGGLTADEWTQRKAAVYEEYGILQHAPGQYEIDHLIPLEAGGSNDIANLWPQPAAPKPGFHEKDLLENRAHQAICVQRIPLATVQADIARDWYADYMGSK